VRGGRSRKAETTVTRTLGAPGHVLPGLLLFDLAKERASASVGAFSFVTLPASYSVRWGGCATLHLPVEGVMLNKTILREIALLAGWALVSVPAAHATTINFDDTTGNIDTHYAGVTFSNPIGGDIFAVANTGAQSAPNTVSVFNSGVDCCFDARFGAVEALFATPQSIVSIDASPVLFVEPLGSTNRPFIEFFDSSNTLLKEVLWSLPLPSVGAGAYQTLSFNAGSSIIDHVIFSSQHISGQQDVFGQFDNLTFTAASGVPEPGTLLLLGSGLFGLAALRRRKRKVA
jgi:hypothetical protein